MRKEDCIFCKILNKEIPSYKVYEDDLVYCFLDISQATRGHTLCIPKDHYDNYLELPDDLLAHLMKVAKLIGKTQMRALNAKGVNILTNVNKEAGQSVYHTHIHVIPRYDETDAFEAHNLPHEINYSLDEVAETLRKEF